MEALSTYNIKGYKFIVWFFRLLLFFAVMVIVLLSFLKINETVSLKEGKVIAADPEANYTAPFDTEILKINVREGQAVRKGDTLIVLQHADLPQRQERLKTDSKFLEDEIAAGDKGNTVGMDNARQLSLSQQGLSKIETDISRLHVIASSSGTANYVFNTESTTSFIEKGEVLVTVSPHSEQYYAKVPVDEKDIQHIKAGMTVRLKLEAYNSNDDGIVNGKVSYVSERKHEDKFYALIDLPKSPKLHLKPGYTIDGEVILDRVPLYKYFIKKLL